MQKTAGTLKTILGKQDQPGAVDRMMTPAVSSAASNVLPQQWQQPVLDHYQRYQHLYNPALVGLAGTAAYKGISALTDDDDDRPRRSRGGVGSWLVPMALIGGGAYLWNRYGDQIANGIKNFSQIANMTPGQKKDLETAGKIGHVFRRTGQVADRLTRTIPLINIFRPFAKNTNIFTEKNRNLFSYIPIIGDAQRAMKVWDEPWD